MGKLIIDGNSVYEIDEECLKKRKISPACGIEQALKKQAEREKKRKRAKMKKRTHCQVLFLTGYV